MTTNGTAKRVTEADLRELKDRKGKAAFKRSNAQDADIAAKAAAIATSAELQYWTDEYARLENEYTHAMEAYHAQQQEAHAVAEGRVSPLAPVGKLSHVERIVAQSQAERVAGAGAAGDTARLKIDDVADSKVSVVTLRTTVDNVAEDVARVKGDTELTQSLAQANVDAASESTARAPAEATVPAFDPDKARRLHDVGEVNYKLAKYVGDLEIGDGVSCSKWQLPDGEIVLGHEGHEGHE
jgi:hypothetical protein